MVVSDPLVDVEDGNTPIDEEEARGLRLSWVRTRGDLNEAEAANIRDGRRAIRAASLDDVTDDLWLRRLHKLMFGDVWAWAGTYRLSDRNIGIDWAAVPASVRDLVADCRTWTALDRTEIPVARFHHRLVVIHPFPNGNGRHARAAADYLSIALGLSIPTWGARIFTDTIELRAAYLSALRVADRDPDDLEALREFMWS